MAMAFAEPNPNEPINTELHSSADFGQAGEEEKTSLTSPDQSLQTSPASDEAASLLQSLSEDEQVNQDTESQIDIEDSGAIFQAVGIITGEVNINEDGKSTVTIGRSQYPLFYVPRKRKVFEALQKEIEATGNRNQRLVVYPKQFIFHAKSNRIASLFS